MKDFTVTVRVERHLRQWLVSRLGEPVKFPSRSYENLLLSRVLQKPPRERPAAGGTGSPAADEGRAVRIVIPDNDLKRPEYYHYLSRRAERAVAAAIDALFRLHLWSALLPLLGQRGELNRAIDAWCAAQGIALDQREAVRQRFYRMRRAYEAGGIILGKKYGKTAAKAAQNEQTGAAAG